MLTEYIIQPQKGLAFSVSRNALIQVVDLEGRQVVDFFAVNQQDPQEFLSPGVTIDCNESLAVSTGDTLYTNLYRPMLTILADDVGRHDLIHPCCRREMYDFFYQNGEGHPNCLDNINGALKKFSVPPRGEITPFNIFMHTQILTDGKFSVLPPLSKAGDRVLLRAEMDLIVGAASCSVAESSCNGGGCGPIKIVLEEPSF